MRTTSCLRFSTCLFGFLLSSVTLSLRLYTSSAPCSTVHCQRYAECVSTDNATGVCVCPHECPYQRSSVCGSDGKTYINDCHLRVASCRRKANVSVHYTGECSKWRLLFTLIIVLIYQLISLPENETCKPLPFTQSFWFLTFRLRTSHHPLLLVIELLNKETPCACGVCLFVCLQIFKFFTF